MMAQLWKEPTASSLSTVQGFYQQEFFPRFAGYYHSLHRLPRRVRRLLQRHYKQSLVGVALLLTLGQGHALAATITVGGSCTLVDAITAANADAIASGCPAGSGADTIVLPAASTQTLTAVNNTTFGPTGLPVITSTITIEGNHSTITRSSTAPAFRIFAINSTGNLTLNQTTVSRGALPPGSAPTNSGGGIFNSGTLTLTNSTVTGNGVYHRGGGIYNFGGTVTIASSTLSANSAFVGGGIANASGTVTLVNSTVSDHQVTAGGGVYSAGTLIVTGSTISENGAVASGGGIRSSGILILTDSLISVNEAGTLGGGGLSNSGTAAVINSTISGNHGGSLNGGGISNNGTLVLINSSVSGNLARLGGAGIANTGVLTVLNSTISDNDGFNFLSSNGGGLSNTGTAAVVNSTISGNHATTSGGGVFNNGILGFIGSTITDNLAQAGLSSLGVGGGVSSGGTLILARTLIAGNTGAGGLNIANNGTVIADNYNLFGFSGNAGVGGFTPGATDIVPSVPLSAILDPTLADNGGPTLTHALASGSPAVDTSPDDAFCEPTDQRGVPRPQGAACDIGAYELTDVLPPVCGNGVLEVGEECDDGNTVNGDGCSAACTIEPPPPGDPHDLAITDLVAPRAVTLTATRPLQIRIVRVQMQNRSPHVETIPDQATLDNLLDVKVESLGGCPTPTLVQSSALRFPITLEPKEKLIVRFTTIFDCANDPAQSTKINPGHEDFRFTAMVDHSALDGEPDTHPADDVCPRSVTPPFELDPNPDGTIQDKGCGRRKPDGTFGAEVLTDVIDKR